MALTMLAIVEGAHARSEVPSSPPAVSPPTVPPAATEKLPPANPPGMAEKGVPGIPAGVAEKPPANAPSGGAKPPGPNSAGGATDSRLVPIDCDEPRTQATVGGANIGLNPTASVQAKSWQAPYGMIVLTIDSFTPIPPGSSIGVCFRWAQHPKPAKYSKARRPTRAELSTDGKQLKVTTIVPIPEGAQPPRWQSEKDPNVGEYAVMLVPLAEVRIILSSNDPKQPYFADVTTRIGITNVVWALTLVAVTLAVAFAILSVISARRLRSAGILDVNPLLRIIATQDGHASLSQFQIILWTFLVGASAIYVMALSGQLIQVTSGTLVLLGIAGAATIGAKIHTVSQASSAQGAATIAAAEKSAAEKTLAEKTAAAQSAANAAAEPAAAQSAANEQRQAAQTASEKTAAHDAAVAKAETLAGRSPMVRKPLWSDLVVSDTGGHEEIDVTRVQMLYFTLIGAAFVVMQVATTYVIPEIPDGFLLLMGISNGVYVGSKFVGPS